MNFISLIKSLLLVLLFSIFSFGSANAKCNFIMDLGKKYKKFHERKYGPLPEEMFDYAEFDFLAQDICLSDNFDGNFIVRHIFLEKKLMAIKFFAYISNDALTQPRHHIKAKVSTDRHGNNNKTHDT